MKQFLTAAALSFLAFLPSAHGADQASGSRRFDGMSAIEIEVAAALRKQSEQPTVEASLTSAPLAAGSAVNFARFDIVEIKGRPGHEGEFPIPGDPQPGAATGLAELSARVAIAQFRLVTESGELIDTIDLVPPSPPEPSRAFLGEFNVPSQPFRVGVEGTDLDGEAFDAVYDRLFRPQSLEVRFEPEILAVEPGLVELDAVVTNFGPTGSFAIEVTTELGLTVSSNASELTLEAGASAPIVVTLDVPAISTGILDIHVTATATSTTDELSSNHGSVLARLERFERLFWDGFD